MNVFHNVIELYTIPFTNEVHQICETNQGKSNHFLIQTAVNPHMLCIVDVSKQDNHFQNGKDYHDSD